MVLNYQLVYLLFIQDVDKFHSAINIDVSKASKEAIKKVEEYGGKICCSYYDRIALRVLLKPHKFLLPFPRRASPRPKDLKYYISDENRGYLSPSMQDTYNEMWKKIQLKTLEERKKYFEKYPSKHVMTIAEKALPPELQCNL